MLAELTGSKVRAKIIGWLFSHPDEEYYVRRIESIIGEDSTNISRELAKLEALGLLKSRSEGRQKYYRADRACSIFEELKGIALKTTGLADILKAQLEGLGEKICFALVFGSHATGEIAADSDIDLLIVGDIGGPVLAGALRKAEEKLKRPINDIHFSRAEFEKRRRETDPFLSRILEGEKIVLIGEIGEDRRPVKIEHD